MFEINEFVKGRKSDTSEIELRFRQRDGSPLDGSALERVIRAVRQTGAFVAHRVDMSRVVYGTHKSGGDVRAIVKPNGDVTFESKARVRIVDNKELGIRLSESDEKRVELTKSEFEKGYKVVTVRQKQRASFSHKDGHWRVDVTVAETNGAVSYEVELELLKENAGYIRAGDTICRMILCAIQGGDVVITKTQAMQAANTYARLLRIPRPAFVGPLPYTLTRDQLESGVLTCGYAVTDKADGERFLLFVDENKTLYTIGRGKKVASTIACYGKSKNAIPLSLLDGELVGRTFYVFDCLVAKSKDMRQKGLRERLDAAQQVANSIGMHSRSALTLGGRDTPVSIKRRAASAQQARPKSAHAFSVRMKTFYYDVHSQAAKVWASRAKKRYTLDGLVFTPVNAPYFNKGIYKWKPHNTVDLFVKKRKQTESHETWDLMVATFDRQERYVHKGFEGLDGKGLFLYKPPGGKFVTSAKIQSPIASGTVVVPVSVAPKYKDESVVEFDIQNNTFVPMRPRADKQFANGIHSVNDALVAASDSIKAKEFNVKQPKFCGRGFHNAIKDSLISKHMVGKVVLDIGSGAGGDIKKYERHNVKRVVGIDVVQVQYPFDARKMAFHVVPKGQENSYRVLDITRDKKMTYDVVNCQFALHYFFKSRTTLDNLLRNIKETLKKGGLFVATCLDGDAVLAQGNTDNDAVRIRLGKQQNNIVGSRVDVMLKGTRYFTEESNEYIVKVPLFVELMKENGFRLLEQRPFSSYCKEHSALCNMMNKNETSFSFLNCSLVFVRL